MGAMRHAISVPKKRPATTKQVGAFGDRPWSTQVMNCSRHERGFYIHVLTFLRHWEYLMIRSLREDINFLDYREGGGGERIYVCL